jgi:cystathionine beta-lyase
MKYNFDQIIDRSNTNSIKYDFAREFGKPADILPLWVADMDFQTPPEVIRELKAAAEHGIFGYSSHREDYLKALHGWFSRRFNWDFDDNWLVKTPGVVYAIATAIRAFTNEGDGILIQQPVYYPFAGLVKNNNRKLVVNSLVRVSDKAESRPADCTVVFDNDYQIDFADFEEQIIAEQVRMFILCSPHNPVGRVWTRTELEKLGEICLRHNVLVIADEIHADFVFPGRSHTIFTSLSDELANKTILCTAPSKTFNLAGLQAANIFIADANLRRKFQAEMSRGGVSEIGVMGLVACQAAYTYGDDWLDQLLIYLQNNLSWLEKFLVSELPQISVVRPEGTYLVWLDFRRVLPDDSERKRFMTHAARLWLDEGTMFGEEGSGYERINIACPRAVLERAMRQLKQALF